MPWRGYAMISFLQLCVGEARRLVHPMYGEAFHPTSSVGRRLRDNHRPLQPLSHIWVTQRYSNGLRFYWNAQ